MNARTPARTPAANPVSKCLTSQYYLFICEKFIPLNTPDISRHCYPNLLSVQDDVFPGCSGILVKTPVSQEPAKSLTSIERYADHIRNFSENDTKEESMPKAEIAKTGTAMKYLYGPGKA
ncbi:hypothetical protein EDC01DRAFT_627327 [Geopyxis carbonaria]|nr:hypothetical protein EDC01DRAFT_627327 [Geopyxis carbonaria]